MFHPSLYYWLDEELTAMKIDSKTRQKFKGLLDLKKFPARNLSALLTPISSQSFEITKKKQDGLDEGSQVNT